MLQHTALTDWVQIKQEAELRGHTDGVTNLAWHPVHPDKLASIAGQEKSVRWVQLSGWRRWLLRQ